MGELIEIRHVVGADGTHCRWCGEHLTDHPADTGWYADKPIRVDGSSDVVAFSPPWAPMSRYPDGPSFDCWDFATTPEGDAP